MIFGDDVFYKESLDILPDIEFAITKERKSSTAGKMLNPEKTKLLIREKAKSGLLRLDRKLLKIDDSIDMEVIMKTPVQADVIEIIPGVKRISPTIVAYEAKNIIEAGSMLDTMCNACCVLYIGIY